jgi:plasmid stabilization system protein ParE
MAATTEIAAKPKLSAKDEVRALLDRLPDTVTLEDIHPEFEDRTRRETFVHEWRVMYRVEDRRLRVMRVVHGRRLLSNVPGSFEESPQEEYRAA